MRKKRRSSKKKAHDRSFDSHFEKLKPLIEKLSHGSFRKNAMFALSVRASLVKCFEFNSSVKTFAKSKESFFAMASLRGLCEDLIVLRFLRGMKSADREKLILALFSIEVATRAKLQEQFFSVVRPQQPVIRHNDPDSSISSNEALARSIWQLYGWPNLSKGSMPQLRQIAERQGLHQLTVLYDYLYRLTSSAVHFNVQSLFRSGWGESFRKFRFSTKNFHGYYENYCLFYGAFLFCLYFEFFHPILKPSKKELKQVDELRRKLLFTRRWPEMMTFEEMNQKEPRNAEGLRIIVTSFQAVARKRLIGKGVNYENPNSAEARQIKRLLKILKMAQPKAQIVSKKKLDELGSPAKI